MFQPVAPSSAAELQEQRFREALPLEDHKLEGRNPKLPRMQLWERGLQSGEFAQLDAALQRAGFARAEVPKLAKLLFRQLSSYVHNPLEFISWDVICIPVSCMQVGAACLPGLFLPACKVGWRSFTTGCQKACPCACLPHFSLCACCSRCRFASSSVTLIPPLPALALSSLCRRVC